MGFLNIGVSSLSAYYSTHRHFIFNLTTPKVVVKISRATFSLRPDCNKQRKINKSENESLQYCHIAFYGVGSAAAAG
jgi:hypothetical protein